MSLALDKGEIVTHDAGKAAQWVLRGCKINGVSAYALNSPESSVLSEETRRAIQTSARCRLYSGASTGD